MTNQSNEGQSLCREERYYKNAGFHGFLHSWFLWQEEEVREKFLGPSFDWIMKNNVASKIFGC